MASRPHNATVPLGSASAMKGWKGHAVTSAPGATQAFSLTACRATSASPSGTWSSASCLIGPSSSWTGLMPSKSLESLAHTSRRSTPWKRSSVKLKPSLLKIQLPSPWKTLGISLRKQSEYSHNYMDKSGVERSGSASELGFTWVTGVPMLGWGHPALRLQLWLLVLVEHLAMLCASSEHPSQEQKPGQEGRSSAAAMLWAGVVLLHCAPGS